MAKIDGFQTPRPVGPGRLEMPRGPVPTPMGPMPGMPPPPGAYAPTYGGPTASAGSLAMQASNYTGAQDGASGYGSRSVKGNIPNPAYRGPRVDWRNPQSSGPSSGDLILASLPPQMRPTYMRVASERDRMQSELNDLMAEKRELQKEMSSIKTTAGKGGKKTREGEVSRMELKDKHLADVNANIKEVKEKLNEVQGRLDSFAGLASYQQTMMGGPPVQLPA